MCNAQFSWSLVSTGLVFPFQGRRSVQPAGTCHCGPSSSAVLGVSVAGCSGQSTFPRVSWLGAGSSPRAGCLLSRCLPGGFAESFLPRGAARCRGADHGGVPQAALQRSSASRDTRHDGGGSKARAERERHAAVVLWKGWRRGSGKRMLVLVCLLPAQTAADAAVRTRAGVSCK